MQHALFNMKPLIGEAQSKMRPCIGVKPNGKTCAHCNCMAGAEEACSHIAALLYTVSGVRMQQETSITSEQSQWLEVTGPVNNFKCTGSIKILFL